MLYPVELRGRENRRGSETESQPDPNVDTITYGAADHLIYALFDAMQRERDVNGMGTVGKWTVNALVTATPTTPLCLDGRIERR